MAKSNLGFRSVLSLMALGFTYELEVNDSKFEMLVHMDFAQHVTLQQIYTNFTSEEILTKFNSHIDSWKLKSIPIQSVKPGTSMFESILVTQTYGFESTSRSECVQSRNFSFWSRRCVLDLTEFNVDRYMQNQTDELICNKVKDKFFTCDIKIKGEVRAIELFGFTFMTASEFALRSKQMVLMDFGSIWSFTNYGSVSIRQAAAQFKKSELGAKIEEILTQGVKNLKKAKGSFRFR